MQNMRNKIIPYYQNLRENSRDLRKQGILVEVLLWKKIKGKALGVEFHRQVPMLSYVVDFYCHEIMLAIELDGYSHTLDGAAERDEERQKKLEGVGVKFIRFNDIDVKYNMPYVLGDIREKIQELQRGGHSAR